MPPNDRTAVIIRNAQHDRFSSTNFILTGIFCINACKNGPFAPLAFDVSVKMRPTAQRHNEIFEKENRLARFMGSANDKHENDQRECALQRRKTNENRKSQNKTQQRKEIIIEQREKKRMAGRRQKKTD